jgi:hypothetical protein
MHFDGKLIENRMDKTEKITTGWNKGVKLREKVNSQSQFRECTTLKTNSLIRTWGMKFRLDPLQLLILFLILVIVIPIALFFYYHAFLDKLEVSIPLFKELNTNVLRQIPPPKQASETIQTSSMGNIDNFVYGTEFNVSYKFSGMRVNDIIDYYNDLLVNHSGWTKVDQEHNLIFYQNKSACINLSIFTDTYVIKIWHDFEHQEFSPFLPPAWLLKMFDGGYGHVLLCR